MSLQYIWIFLCGSFRSSSLQTFWTPMQPSLDFISSSKLDKIEHSLRTDQIWAELCYLPSWCKDPSWKLSTGFCYIVHILVRGYSVSLFEMPLRSVVFHPLCIHWFTASPTLLNNWPIFTGFAGFYDVCDTLKFGELFEEKTFWLNGMTPCVVSYFVDSFTSFQWPQH